MSFPVLAFGRAVTNSTASFKLNIKKCFFFSPFAEASPSDICRSVLGELMTVESALETAQHEVKISQAAKVR